MTSYTTHGFPHPDGGDAMGLIPNQLNDLAVLLEQKVKHTDSGTFQVNLAANVAQDIVVNFNFTFASTPNVVIVPGSSVADVTHAVVKVRSTTQVTFTVKRSTAVNTTFYWIAHG